MRKPILSFALVCLATLAIGCAHTKPDPASLDLFRAAGDQSTLTVVFRPDRWVQASKTLTSLLGGFPIEPARKALSAPDAWTSFVEAITATGEGKDLPRELTGWDQKRPLVLALFEPQVGELALAARSLLPLSPGEMARAGVPGMRHRVLVPATDAPALARTLMGLFEKAGFSQPPMGGEMAGFNGGGLLTAPDGFVGVIVEPGRVRIELLTDEYRPSRSEAERMQAWIAMATKPVAPAAATETPAVLLATSGKHLVSAYVRPWLLRDLGAQIGSGQVFRALEMVSPDMKMQLLAAGLSEVANGTLLMTGDGAEFEDLALAMDLSDGARWTWVATLSPQGQKVFQAGLDQGADPPRASADKVLMSAWSRVSVRAMFDEAEPLAALTHAKKPQEMARAIQECGLFCPLHLMLRSPMGAGKAVIGMVPGLVSEKITSQMPTAMSLAIEDVDPTWQGAPFRGAMSLTYPADHDPGPMRTALEMLNREMGKQNAIGLRSAKSKKATTVTVHWGADPDALFTEKKRAPSKILGEVDMDLAGLIQRMIPGLGMPPDAAGMAESFASKVGRLRMRSVLTGRAMVAEGLLSLTGAKPLAYHSPRGYGDDEFLSAAPTVTSSKGERCLTEVTRSMIEAFRALAMVAPEQRNLLMARAIAETDPSIACALADPVTKERAEKTAWVQTRFVADRLDEDFNTEGVLAVLEKTCARGIQPACDRVKEVKSRPKLKVPTIEGQCTGGTNWGQPVLRVADAAQAKALSVEPGSQEPALVFDASTAFSTVQAALDALKAKGVDRPWFLARAKGGGVRALGVELPGAKPKPDDGMHRFVRLEEQGQPAESHAVVRIAKGQVEILANGRSDSFPQKGDCTSIQNPGIKTSEPKPVAELKQVETTPASAEEGAVSSIVATEAPELKSGQFKVAGVIGKIPSSEIAKLHSVQCLDHENVAKRLTELGELLGDGLQIYVEANPGTSYADLVGVVDAALCAGKKARYGQTQQRRVILGPAPKEVKDLAMRELFYEKRSGEQGVLKLLGTKGGSGEMHGVFGGLGTDADNALGGLVGGTIGPRDTGGGFGGLGTKGSGTGVGLGGLGTKGVGKSGRVKGQVKIHSGKPVIKGSLPKEIIQRIIRRKLSAFKYCYEKELLRDPKLAGKIVVQFAIGPNGSVNTAKVKSSTLKNEKVDGCIVRQIKRLRFPSNPGVVVVSYPFIFKSADQ